MRTTKRVLACAAALLLVVPSSLTATAAPVPAPAAGTPIPGQYLVTLSKGTQVLDVIDKLGIKPLEVYTTVFRGFAAKLSTLQLTLLKAVSGVLAIEQDAVVSVPEYRAGTPQRAVGSWGLDRIDQTSLPLNNTYSPGHDGSGVTAYIVDTGIAYNHSEFGGRAKLGIDKIGDGRAGADCNGHGTHVAGTVGGTTYGVAKKVNLVSVRVLGCDGRGSWSGIIAGFDWIAANAKKPAVVNASLGGTPGLSSVDSAADSLTDKGAFVSVAAGNDTADACKYTPARASKVFTIGATTRTDGYSSFSNLGECVQLLAPGTDITSAWHNGGTNTISGTSMASPHVAGVAALFKQAYGDRSQNEIMQWLWEKSTVDLISSVPAGTPNLLLNLGGL